MGVRIHLPARVGATLFLIVLAYALWWVWTFTGSSGELTPRSRARVMFPILGHTAMHTRGYTWARQGDIIVLDYDVKLETGYFSLTVGKTRWLRRLLSHEQNRSFRSSAAGQLRYTVKEDGRHAIWAGTYSVWSGEARIRWSVIRGSAHSP